MIKMMNEKEIRNEFINCIEGSHTLNLAISVLEEREQLQNNWNELKKWLGTRINNDKDYEINSHIKEKLQVEDYVIKQVMFFMQELEQGKDD